MAVPRKFHDFPQLSFHAGLFRSELANVRYSIKEHCHHGNLQMTATSVLLNCCVHIVSQGIDGRAQMFHSAFASF